MEPETAVSKMEEIQFNLFLHNLRDEEKRLYRKYEKTYFRIITTTKAIAFMENNDIGNLSLFSQMTNILIDIYNVLDYGYL